MKQGTLIRNAESGRMDIRFGLNEFREGISCGTRMDVLIDGDWVPTRIEMENDWILVGIKTQNIVGLTVRLKN
ncbi:MAG: DUF5348 domain-containing protein [Oscillospiraceae bacterium]|nr:DUF5348 domain-containing protein [Oscillospiraceae bacterium]